MQTLHLNATAKRVLVTLLAIFVISLLLAVPALAAITHNGILCDGGESNCLESWYGGSLRVYSDGGTTQKFAVVGSNGNTSVGGTLNVTGASTLASATTISSTLNVTGTLTGGAQGSVAYTTIYTATVANLNANSGNGTQIITVPAGRSFRLDNFKFIPYGANCATATTIDLDAGSGGTKLATLAIANATRSTVSQPGSTGITVLADGASFLPQTQGTSIYVARTGSDVATCTGVIFVVDYALE